jgi:Tfp pilus assembly protein PilO
MKELANKFISNIHFIILAYGLYSAWIVFDEHSIRMTDLDSQFPGIQAEIANNQKRVKEIQEFVKKAEESKVRVEEVAKNIESAQKQLPAEINDNQIITFFNGEIAQLNIKDSNIVPGTEVPSTYFISKDYTLKANGTFLQFLVFFERIGNTTRIYNVKSLKLVNADSNQRGRFHLISGESTIEAFRYNPDFKVDRGFDAISPVTP